MGEEPDTLACKTLAQMIIEGLVYSIATTEGFVCCMLFLFQLVVSVAYIRTRAVLYEESGIEVSYMPLQPKFSGDL